MIQHRSRTHNKALHRIFVTLRFTKSGELGRYTAKRVQ
jgi:hypothetical protein